jgi:hypothetical protein
MQSIASDIVLVTGIYMAPRARKHGVSVVNTVYDSILYEVPYDIPLIQDLAAETVDRLSVTAREWGIRRIPITGEAKVGKRWGQLQDIEKWLQQAVETVETVETTETTCPTTITDSAVATASSLSSTHKTFDRASVGRTHQQCLPSHPLDLQEEWASTS